MKHENIFAPLAKKVTKQLETEAIGKDTLAKYRMQGMHKLTSLELPTIKVAAMAELIYRARG